MHIFERLKQERERLGFTQEAFAAIGGVSRRAQSNYESGERSPDLNYLAAVAKVGVDVQFVVLGISSVALNSDEGLLIEGFRQMDAKTKHRTLAMVYDGTPPAAKFNVQGNVDNQFENNHGNINIDKRGK